MKSTYLEWLKSRVETDVEAKLTQFDTGTWITDARVQMSNRTIEPDMIYSTSGFEASSRKQHIISPVTVSENITEAEIGSALLYGWALANAYRVRTSSENMPLPDEYSVVSYACGRYSTAHPVFMGDIQTASLFDDFDIYSIILDRR
jgi:hypothetical protein